MTEAERTGLDHVVLPRRRPGLAILERHRPPPADNVMDAELAAFASSGDTILDPWAGTGSAARRAVAQEMRAVAADPSPFSQMAAIALLGAPDPAVLDAAFATGHSGNPKVRITNCSLWAAGGKGDQGCISEAVASESAVRSVMAQWYANRKCVYCAKPITPQSLGHRAALRGPQGTTREWSEVPPARLLASLRTDSPVCWNCHVAETLRRTRPELVTDRPWPKNQVRRTG